MTPAPSLEKWEEGEGMRTVPLDRGPAPAAGSDQLVAL